MKRVDRKKENVKIYMHRVTKRPFFGGHVLLFGKK